MESFQFVLSVQADMGQHVILSLKFLHVRGPFYLIIQSVVQQNAFQESIIMQGLTWYDSIVRYNNLLVQRYSLTLSQTTNIRLTTFADDNFKFDENGRKFTKQVENTVGTGEIARYEQFLLFPQCFQKICTADT